MCDSPSFQRWKNGILDGNSVAERALVDRFIQRLIGLVRKRLNPKVCCLEDPEGVADSVLKTVIMHLQDGRFDGYKLESWEALWSLLARIAICKSLNLNEKGLAKKKGLQHEQTLPHSEKNEDSGFAWDPADDTLTPFDEVAINETLERWLRGVDDRDLEFLSLRFKRYTVQQISERTGWAEHTVRRRLKHVEKRLARMLAEP